MPGPPPANLPDALDDAVQEAFESRQVPFLRRLVDTPSHTRAAEDVEVAAKQIDVAVEALGLRTTRHPAEDGGFADHRVYESPAAGDGRCLLLVGHVDTVFPRSMGFLRLERDDGPDGPGTGDIIRGPGVLDMKSGLSCIVFALDALRRVAPERFEALPVRFACNTDEEVGSPSSEPMFHALAPRTSEALVFEGGRDGDRIITQRKGGGTFSLHVTGRAAHAGNDHEAGINAIAAMAYLVPRLEAITDYSHGRTVNVGLIEGGTAKNTVPERAMIVVDTRFVTQSDCDAVVAALHAIADAPFEGTDAPAKLREAKVELVGHVTRPPMEATDASQALRAEYEQHAAAAGLRTGEAPRQGGGSDANLLCGYGIPAIDGLGPYGKFFHNPQEWSSLASLRRRTCALARLLAARADVP